MCDDFIKRGNVYQFDGREKFEQHFDETLIKKYPEHISVLEHYRKLARLFIFEEDPEQGELEAEEDQVVRESKEAQIANAEKM